MDNSAPQLARHPLLGQHQAVDHRHVQEMPAQGVSDNAMPHGNPPRQESSLPPMQQSPMGLGMATNTTHPVPVSSPDTHPRRENPTSGRPALLDEASERPTLPSPVPGQDGRHTAQQAPVLARRRFPLGQGYEDEGRQRPYRPQPGVITNNNPAQRNVAAQPSLAFGRGRSPQPAHLGRREPWSLDQTGEPVDTETSWMLNDAPTQQSPQRWIATAEARPAFQDTQYEGGSRRAGDSAMGAQPRLQEAEGRENTIEPKTSPHSFGNSITSGNFPSAWLAEANRSPRINQTHDQHGHDIRRSEGGNTPLDESHGQGIASPSEYTTWEHRPHDRDGQPVQAGESTQDDTRDSESSGTHRSQNTKSSEKREKREKMKKGGKGGKTRHDRSNMNGWIAWLKAAGATSVVESSQSPNEIKTRLRKIIQRHNIRMNTGADEVSTISAWISEKAESEKRRDEDTVAKVKEAKAEARYFRSELAKVGTAANAAEIGRQAAVREIDKLERRVNQTAEDNQRLQRAVWDSQNASNELERKLNHAMRELERLHKNYDAEIKEGAIIKEERDDLKQTLAVVTSDLDAVKRDRDMVIGQREAALDEVENLRLENQNYKDQHEKELDKMDVHYTSQYNEMEGRHNRELAARTRHFSDEIKKLETLMATTGSNYAAMPDPDLQKMFESIAQKISRVYLFVHRRDSRAVDADLDPTGYLARAGQGDKTWTNFLKSLCWRILIEGFFYYPLGFGALGMNGQDAFAAVYPLLAETKAGGMYTCHTSITITKTDTNHRQSAPSTFSY